MIDLALPDYFLHYFGYPSQNAFQNDLHILWSSNSIDNYIIPRVFEMCEAEFPSWYRPKIYPVIYLFYFIETLYCLAVYLLNLN